MKVPGGMDMNAVKFSEDLRAVALELIPLTRLVVKLPDYAERGTRFNHNDGVLWRLESMFAADDFAIDPISTISAALIDAAKSDYWYAHEKEWSHDYAEETDPGQDAYEAEGC